ncbi:MAG: hypothetical protein IAE93_16665 [Ignavibacteria bacterium]|nr:hypothetical protein [Ignavibacteria bacterium]
MAPILGFSHCNYDLKQIKGLYSLIELPIDKFVYLFWLENDLKSSDSVRNNTLINEWIEDARLSLAGTTARNKTELNPVVQIFIKKKPRQISPYAAQSIINMLSEYDPQRLFDESIVYCETIFKSSLDQISFYNQVISLSKIGNEIYKKTTFESDEMKKKTELMRLIKLKVKELELQLKYHVDKNRLYENREVLESAKPTSINNISQNKNTVRNLISCKIPKRIFSNAFLKLAETEDDGVLINYLDHKDLELQLTMHFSFPDTQFNPNNQVKFKKIKWMKQLTDLAYFIERLSNPNVNIIEVKVRKISDLILTHFCDSDGQDFLLESVSGAKKKYKRNKGAKTNGVRGVPTGYEIIELFIEYLKPS